MNPSPAPPEKKCFSVEIKDGFISHSNSLKKNNKYKYQYLL